MDASLRKFSDGPCRKLLDVACGTGRHAFEFEKLGYAVSAVDHSQDLLSRGREKASAMGSGVRFEHADMRRLKLNDAPFDAVTCLFDSIGYVQDTHSVRAALSAMSGQLRMSGLLILEFWHSPAFLRHHDALRVRRWPVEEGMVLRISETAVDYHRQLATVAYSVYELNRNGNFSFFEEKQVNRFFHVPEMASYLEDSGFSPLKWFDGFTGSETVSDQTWHILAVARKTSDGPSRA